MSTPWQRLRADRSPGTTVVILLLVAGLAFFTSSTLVQFDHGWEPWPAVTGGVLFPTLSVLLVLPNPARYRVVGLSTRQWILDHGLLVALVAVVHLAWPVWATVRPMDLAQGVPPWIPVLPAVAIIVTVALVLHHHRHILAGRLTGTGYRFVGTPLHYRVFLARRGPVLWRVVYQPVGLAAVVTVVVLTGWLFFGEDGDQMLSSGFLVTALATAPVVAASRVTATAVGLSRHSWVRHTMVAGAVPQAVAGVLYLVLTVGASGELPLSSSFGGSASPVSSPGPLLLALYLAITVATAVVGAAFAVSVSYEDWGTAIMWLIGFSFIVGTVSIFAFTSSHAPWPGVAAAAVSILLACSLVTYATRKALLGQADWAMTSIIGSPRSRYGRTAN